MDIAIIGGGATGLLLASHLANDYDVTLYVRRKEQINVIKEHGIHLYHADRRFVTKNVIVRHIAELKSAEYMFVCVKQTQLDTILPLLEKLHDYVQFIFLQNGMGHIDKITHLTQRTFVGVIEHGVKRSADNVVHFLGKGQIRLAPFQAQKKQLEHFITSVTSEHFPFKLEVCWQTMLAQKLIVNAVINPLTALFNVDNGHILTNEHLRHLAKKLCSEAAQSLKLDVSTAWGRVEQTAMTTAHNTSSMRADILAKRKTEIEAISGYLIRRTEKNELPYTSFVYKSILALEKERDSYDQ